MSIYSMIDSGRDESDFDVIDRLEPSEFDEWFKSYCGWCWGHGYGDCTSCKKHYRQLKLAKKINDKYKLQTGKNVWE